jgi:hypothetical protein
MKRNFSPMKKNRSHLNFEINIPNRIKLMKPASSYFPSHKPLHFMRPPARPTSWKSRAPFVQYCFSEGVKSSEIYQPEVGQWIAYDTVLVKCEEDRFWYAQLAYLAEEDGSRASSFICSRPVRMIPPRLKRDALNDWREQGLAIHSSQFAFDQHHLPGMIRATRLQCQLRSWAFK